jgi:SecD/SecF fusion protein
VSSFAIPMLFGIVVCASSSVFIAAPILLLLGDGRLRMGRGSEATKAAITAKLQRVEDPAA